MLGTQSAVIPKNPQNAQKKEEKAAFRSAKIPDRFWLNVLLASFSFAPERYYVKLRPAYQLSRVLGGQMGSTNHLPL